jgi:hypothetical protein
MKKRYLQLFLFIGLLPLVVGAQSINPADPANGKYRFFEIKGHSGMHIYSGQSLTEELVNGYGSFELRYGWQTKGSQEWQKSYLYPAFGIGWYSGYIGDVDIFGNPNALYGFASFPLSHHKKHVFLIEPALGLTYNLIPYDPETNMTNDAIGSRVAVYFNLNFGGKLQLNREMDLTYGIDFTHFSNGRTATPNFGLNMFGLNVGARYHFNRMQKQVDRSINPTTLVQARPTYGDYTKPKKLNRHVVRLYQAVGTVQNDRDAGTSNRYFTSSTVLEYQFRFSEMHSVYAGGDFFYDGSVEDTISVPSFNTHKTTTFPGFHLGYEFSFWQIGVGVQFGVYLSDAARDYKDSNVWLRPNVKWDFSKYVYAQVGLKTFNGAAADWVEYGIGIRLGD